MSTRAQVKIEAKKLLKGYRGAGSTTLYHHTDGYPTHMLELFSDAWKSANSQKYKSHINSPSTVTSYIIASEPDVFEIEKSHKLHGDIEWYYKIHPSTEEKEWTVDIYKVPFGENKKLFAVKKGLTVNEAAKQAEAIEHLEMKEAKKKVIKV